MPRETRRPGSRMMQKKPTPDLVSTLIGALVANARQLNRGRPDPGYFWSTHSCVEPCFGRCWRDIRDGCEQVAGIEPIDFFVGGIQHGIEATPWRYVADVFCHMQPIDRLSQCIVSTVDDVADRLGDRRF